MFVGLMIAVGVLRSSGLLETLGQWLSIPAGWLHLPTELVPVTLVRLVSNSAATGLLLDLFEKAGPDSPLGMCASVMMSCTETVFYCLSVYFGSVQCKKNPVCPGRSFICHRCGSGGQHMADFGFFIKKTQPCKNFLINSRLSNK